MSSYYLSSLSAFDEPLTYHQTAINLLDFHADEIVRRAQPLIAEMQNGHPEAARNLHLTITKMSQRLRDEVNGHTNALRYLESHRSVLAHIEASLSGTTFTTLPLPGGQTEFPSFHPPRSAVNGIVAELRQKLEQIQHELYTFDTDLGNLEDLLWRFEQDASQFHLPWFVEDAVRGILGDLYIAVKTFRDIYDKMFLPAIDGEIAQPFINYLNGLHNDYHTVVMQPFESVTNTFVTDYQPPPQVAQYHQSLQHAQPDQLITLNALASMSSRLQGSVEISDLMTGFLMTTVACVLLAAAAVAVLVGTALLSTPVSAPVAVSSGGEAGISGTAAFAQWNFLVANLAAWSAEAGIPAWAWFVVGGSLTLPGIHQLDPDAPQQLIDTITQIIGAIVLYNIMKRTSDGQTIRVRKLTSREVRGLKTDWGTPFEQEKSKQGYPANADIYEDEDGNYWIGVPGSDLVTEFP